MEKRRRLVSRYAEIQMRVRSFTALFTKEGAAGFFAPKSGQIFTLLYPGLCQFFFFFNVSTGVNWALHLAQHVMLQHMPNPIK